LSGEAFFDVAKVPASGGTKKKYRGFQVQTPNMTVHVLGTIFNVVARQVNTEVFLQEGAVELQLPEVKEVLKRMVPGDKVVMDNQTGEITERESENLLTSASWVTGILNYQDKSLGEVLNNLSELFGVEITCEIPALHKKKINLGVPYMDWENTRKALEMSLEVEFRKEGESYRVEYKDQKNVK
jgi:ferric-dicitrate binding protein FerR (iron transport regulator)